MANKNSIFFFLQYLALHITIIIANLSNDQISLWTLVKRMCTESDFCVDNLCLVTISKSGERSIDVRAHRTSQAAFPMLRCRYRGREAGEFTCLASHGWGGVKVLFVYSLFFLIT